jgi:hypothetical protein
MKEVWKEVVGYEDLYQVSNIGNVKRTKLLKLNIDRKGYYFVNLSKNGKVKCCRVHQLVAKAFIPNPNNFIEINHVDGIKTNNNIDNLEWCDHQHNMKHAHDNNLIPREGVLKVINAMVSKRKKPVLQIKNGIVVREFESCASARRETGIINVSTCAKGLRKTAGGYVWKWK